MDGALQATTDRKTANATENAAGSGRRGLKARVNHSRSASTDESSFFNADYEPFQRMLVPSVSFMLPSSCDRLSH